MDVFYLPTCHTLHYGTSINAQLTFPCRVYLIILKDMGFENFDLFNYDMPEQRRPFTGRLIMADID